MKTWKSACYQAEHFDPGRQQESAASGRACAQLPGCVPGVASSHVEIVQEKAIHVYMSLHPALYLATDILPQDLVKSQSHKIRV